MVEQDDTFSREIDEELRREQLAQLWEKYGVLALVVAAAIVVGIGGWKLWEYQTQVQAQAAGARFEKARALQAAGKLDDARAAFSAIGKDAPAGYAVLAAMEVAGGLAKAGKIDDAVAAYDAVSKRGDDEFLVRLAALQAALLRSDKADWNEMKNRLTPLAVDKGPWRWSALELLGTAAMRAGQPQEARSAFEQILSGRGVPDGVTRRVQDMMAYLTAQQVATAKPAAGGHNATVPGVAAPAKPATDAKK